MKRQVQDYIKSLGGSSAYSGNTRTLYINDPLYNNHGQQDIQSIESAILIKFGFGLPFTLKTNDNA